MNTLLRGFIEGLADNHAHVHMHPDAKKVLTEFVAEGGEYLLEVCVHPTLFNEVLKVKSWAQDVVHLAFGIHPEYLKPPYALLESERRKRFANVEEAFVAFDRVFREYADLIDVIGEVGIDIYRVEAYDVKKVLHQQEELFGRFIEFAKLRSVPLMLHLRGSSHTDYSVYERALKVLAESGVHSSDDLFVYFHSFTADKVIAAKLASAGFRMGFNGIVTYSSAKHLRDVVKSLPQELILIETDTPFLVPASVNKKYNDPLSVREIVKGIGG